MSEASFAAVASLSAREHARVRGGEVPVPDKQAALLDICRMLDALGVAHAVIGGVAVGIRSGVPRATLDTDVGVESTLDVDAVLEAATSAGFVLRGRHAHSLNFLHASGEPVQLAFDPSFDEALRRAGRVPVGDAFIPVVSKADLILMKGRAANAPARRRSMALRDLADVALLEGDVGDPDEGW